MSGLSDEILIALHRVWHRRWVALGLAWLVCLAGWLVVAGVPNSYESKARIYVELDNALADQIGIHGDGRRDVEHVRETLTSTVNLQKVIRATRLGEGVTTDKAMVAAVAALAGHVRAVSQQDNLFEISATSANRSISDADNARLAQDIVARMIDIFREENLAGGRGEMSDTLAFMDQQLGARQKDLEAAEQKRQAFEAEHAGLLPGSAALGERLESTRSELAGVESDLLAAESALAAVNGQLAATPQLTASAGAAGGTRGALERAQADLAAARARGLTDSHPDVVALSHAVAALARDVASEGPRPTSGVTNPAWSSLQSVKAEREANLVALRARKGALQTEVARLSGQQYSQPAVAAEAARVNRDYDVLKEQYDKLLRDREQLRLRGQVENEHNAVKFEVIDPPSLPHRPSAPDRPMLLVLVLVVGLGAGALAAYGLAQLRGTFATTSQLERLTGVEVIGSVSLALSPRQRGERRRYLQLFALASVALVTMLVVLLVLDSLKRGMVA